MFKKAITSLVLGIVLGLTLPMTAEAISFPEAGGRGSYSSTVSEDTANVDPIVTPATTSETITCEEVTHAHWHTNVSENTSSRYFRAAVYATAITLEDDFMETIDTENLFCSNGNSIWIDCSFNKTTTPLGTELYDSRDDTVNLDRWNGTTITYQTLTWIDGDPVGLVWRYGQDDASDVTLLPFINPGQSKGEAINMVPEDYTELQSATTKSWTKLKFFWIDPDVYDDGDGSYSLDDHEEIYPDYVSDSSDGSTDDAGVDADGDFIFWYGINDIEKTNWPVCETPSALTCSKLIIDPATLTVSDVFSDTNFSLTAYNNEGDDITDEVDVTYEAFQYDGSASTGDIMTGILNRTNNGSGPVETSDTNIKYNDSMPGDRLTAYVSDYLGESSLGTGLCEVEVEFPYCSDLNIIDPSSFAFISSGDVDVAVEIEVEASTGEDWPYSVIYKSTDSDATFDGNTQPYTTTDWTVESYQSDAPASVWVDTENDVANMCSDFFTYAIEPTCESLEIIVPGSDTLTCEEMSEEIEIQWQSLMTSGAPATGPWLVTSSNPAGEFALTAGGATVGIGSYTTSDPSKVLFYTGEGGDAIRVMDTSYPACVDSFKSTTCEGPNPVCEDLTLTAPYIQNTDGTETPIDLSDEEDLALLYGESTVCWNFALAISDPSYSGTLLVEGFADASESAYNGNLSVYELNTLSNATGNPVNMGLSGAASYVGIICWENFEANNVLSVSMIGEEAVCSQEVTLPPTTPVEEVPVCVDLQMSPDSYTMSATDVDAGIISVEIAVQGETNVWSGTLVVERTGSGALFYSDGSPSTAGDGSLEIPVSGLSTNVTVFYRNGQADDVVSSYVRGDETLCSDEFTITQQAPGLVCEDLELTPDSVTMDADDEDAGTINGTVTVEGSGNTWTGTLIITKDGSGQLQYSSGASSGYSDGRLEIPVTGSSSTVTFTYTGGQADDDVRAYIQNDSAVCSDEFTITQPNTPPPVCEEIEFPDDEIQTYNCEDVPDVEICVERDEDDQREIEICYEQANGEDGEFEYNGRTYEGCEEIIFNFESGQDNICADITFFEVCEDAQIEVFEEGEICEELETDEVEVGSFEKFIYTFNFAAEKNSYTDEGVFFSHDEDRAFYTLDYDPAGEEEAITFTDAMWGSELEGTKGDGSESGGTMRLATSYQELVEGNSGVYDYKLITKMGFGHSQEWYSDDLAAYVDSDEFKYNFRSFVAYVQYPTDFKRESVLIEECEYDEDGDLESDGVCYDPDHSPTTTEDVVIENAGTVQDDYGVEASIRIRYVGVVFSVLNCGDEADECLTEEFENTASVEVYEDMATLTSTAKLVVLCSYLMTQNAGDVYLEVSLKGGSDIACIFVDENDATSSSYRNVDSLIILEDNGDNNQNDTPDEYMSNYSSSTVSFCDDKDDNLIGNLSSYVCEIVAKVTDLWAKTSVESTTDSRLSQATRNTDTSQVSSDSTYTSWDELEAALTNKNNSDSNILYFDASLSYAGKMTLGSLTVPAGAWTVIVEGGDLDLSGNISYANVSSASGYKNLPSIAFVVQDGDIFIQDSALRLVGVYYTNQKFDGDERSAVDEQLTVEGSFYGNIQTLIERAKYVGPPTIDGGGIVIKYDSRIILNTPPALSDYVNINTEKGVN